MDFSTGNYFFYGIGVVTAVFSFVISKIFFSDDKIKTQLKIVVDAYSLAFDYKTEELDKYEYEKLIKLSEPELKLVGIAKWYGKKMEIQLIINLVLIILDLILLHNTNHPYFIFPFITIIFLLSAYSYNGHNRVIQKGKSMLESQTCFNNLSTKNG